MATRYWVGGSGTWDSTDTTHWSATTGGAGGASAPTSADTVNFDANSGAAAVVSVASTATALITTVNKADINLSLTGSCTLATTGTFTFTAGTITLNNNILTVGIFSSSNANTRAIAFGTGSINVSGGGTNVSIWVMNTTTGFTYTGTPTVNSTYAGAGTGGRTFAHGITGGTEANAVSFSAISSTTDPISFVNGSKVKNLNYSNINAAIGLGTGSFTVYGNLTGTSGNLITAGAAVTFAATSGTQQITTGGATYDIAITQNSLGATVQLQGNLTMGSTRTFTLTAGTLDLTGNNGNWTLSTGLFNSNNTVARAITFGTGNITVTSSGTTVFNMTAANNFTYTGTPTIISNYSGGVGTRTILFGNGSGATATNIPSISINNGSDTVLLSTNFLNLDFTGFSGTLSNNALSLYGNLTSSAGMTYTAGANAITFASTSSGKTITSAGKTMDFPVIFNGIGGVWTCQDALTLGSTRALTMTNGTLNLKSGATSTVGSFVTTGTNQKYLGSSTPGTQATISDASGVNSVSYMTISDSFATGGATWDAFYGNNNVNFDNNTNWDFGESPVLGNEYEYKLRSMTEPRRF